MVIEMSDLAAEVRLVEPSNVEYQKCLMSFWHTVAFCCPKSNGCCKTQHLPAHIDALARLAEEVDCQWRHICRLAGTLLTSCTMQL